MAPGGWPPTVALAATALLLIVPAGAALGAHDGHPDPGHSPSFALFPTHTEVLEDISDHEDHPWITLHTVGQSAKERPIQLLEITDPDSPVPMDERVVTFIFTQQHGNEPAGTPAALQVLDEITEGGTLAHTLSNQILLLLPMANPDGAEVDQRHNAQDKDINRDHIGLSTPEAQALHEVLAQWEIHVAMDHHEYGGIGAGNPVPVRVYDHDLTTLYPRHGNVRAPTLSASQDLMYDGIWPPAEEKGYSANEYGEVTAAGVPVDEIAGGPDPGIMRNHLGLHHIAGLLVETRVDANPNPFHDAERRTDIHRTVMDATLTYVHEHAQRFIDAKAASLEAASQEPDEAYIEGETSGQMAPAYRAQATDDLTHLLLAHGLPGATTTPDGLATVPIEHSHQGHAAALIHPLSSRAVVEDAQPVDTSDAALDPASADEPGSQEQIPALAPLIVGALMALAALLVRRRDQP